MSSAPFLPRFAHPVRGVLVTVVFGPVLVVSAVLAFLALAHTFVSGWIPSRWFSHNIFDWAYAFGTEGGAADYVTFMISALIATFAGSAIRWGFCGRATN